MLRLLVVWPLGSLGAPEHPQLQGRQRGALHLHCTITADTLRLHCTFTADTLHEIAQSLHLHCTNTADTLQIC